LASIQEYLNKWLADRCHDFMKKNKVKIKICYD